ncbi:ExeA family protein [Rubrivivax rivuli]|uniref:Peptidoglycan-binding protein n=1 Tax=Rubrivivax rivuli TaxID=1862385 RepID=A0A437RKX1_9BURK|nr:ExeA family protein [Rubrivivax rivuli]RVU47441.1 peptidoglycan-binding protein [Rubrivivax rivuli]
MYASFFGLSKEPFSIAPDPRFLFMSEQHREALAHLLYGLGGGGGFVLLTGEVGAGKTTVCRCFLEQVPAHCRVAYIFNPKLSVAELLQTVCGEFGIPLPAQADSVKAHVDALNAFLLAGHAKGEQAVLVIDEAQSLSAEVLEQLRLLTNLETAERKLLQIILIGQPELREMVARPELEQLAQRIVARYHLGPLSLAETQQYIQHRLSVAGPSAPLPFSAAALARIHALSGGVPRRINLLADRALLGAYAQGQPRAERRTVQQAAQEVFGRGPALPVAWRWPALAGGVAVLLVLGAVGLLRKPAVPAPVVAAVTGTASQPGASAGGAAPALPGPAPASAPPLAGSAELGALWRAAPVPPATAWRELALRWNVAIGDGEPCAAAAQAQLACFRSGSGGLAVVRQLGRPGWITLRRPEGGSSAALLVALNDSQATLQAGGQTVSLSLATLAGLWPGDFATLWRLPPGWADSPDGGADPAARAWLEQGLLRAGIAAGPTLAERVRQFQRAQGLPPDGRAGPVTVMRLNRLAGVQEARLAGES